MWTSTVGLVSGKHRYLTAETFGFKINSNGQALKKRQQWTIEPFPENLGPDGSVSSAASVSSHTNLDGSPAGPPPPPPQQQQQRPQSTATSSEPCILTFSPSGPVNSSLTSIKSSSNGSSTSDQECYGEEHENVAIKSHLNKYLAVDSFGNVTCDSSEKTDSARFAITICSMSQGRSKDEHIFWAFRNVERGYYLGTTGDGIICCNAKVPKSRAELWHLHLIPARGASFFALRSLGRKRYARVAEGAEEREVFAPKSPQTPKQVQLDATVSWGPETLFQFKYLEGGRYSLLTSDSQYLSNDGKCVTWSSPDESELPPPECLFTLEYHSGFLAFRDSFGHYLAAAGRSSVFKSRSIGVSRDELFMFESAPVQVSLKATFNNRWVSIKQGVDVSANQTETTSLFETFQLTFHKQTQNWTIMTHDCNLWTVSPSINTVSVCKPADYEASNRGQFKIIWSDNDATCSLKFVDSSQQEKWISARKSGQLYLATASQAPVKFIMRFQNRRLLNLRPVDGSGFVGLKSSSSSKQLEANKTAPDSIAIEYSDLPDLNSMVGASDSKCNSVVNGSWQKSPRSSLDTNGQINLFNVKLNSTKTNSDMVQPAQEVTSDQKIAHKLVLKDEGEEETGAYAGNDDVAQKQVSCELDDNNNMELPPAELKGTVESGAMPSVASIISSFSNAKLNDNNQARRQSSTQVAAPRNGSVIMKLASSFGGPQTNAQPQQARLETIADTASEVNSCSTASGTSDNSALTSETSSANKSLTPDQLAQFECCYLKIISNDKYLVVGDNDSNIVCDATNKACAQAWIIELRSHNSVAIRASDNHAYMQLGTNGTIFLTRCDPSQASLWEF